MQVMRELLHGRITNRAAGQLLFAVQLAMTNSKGGMDLPAEEEDAWFGLPQ